MSRVCRLAISTADHLVRKKRLDAAALILENYLSAHPENADVLRRLGRIRLSQGQPQVAAPLLERALRQYRRELERSAIADVGATTSARAG